MESLYKPSTQPPESAYGEHIGIRTHSTRPGTRIEGGEPVEELEGVQVYAKDPTKELKVRRKLQPSTWSKIVAFLR